MSDDRVVVKVCLRRSKDAELLALIESEPRGRRSLVMLGLLLAGMQAQRRTEADAVFGALVLPAPVLPPDGEGKAKLVAMAANIVAGVGGQRPRKRTRVMG